MKPRLYIRPDPYGELGFIWFGELGKHTWWVGPVASKPIEHAIRHFCWMVRHG